MCHLLKIDSQLSDAVKALMPATREQLHAMLYMDETDQVNMYEYKMCCNPQCNTLFRHEHANLPTCRICNHPPAGEPVYYFSIIEHLERVFKTPILAKAMCHHVERDAPQDGGKHDLYDTAVWNDAVLQDEIICADARNAVLLFSADGIKLNKEDNHSPEFWPMIVTLCNLPPALRFLPGLSFMIGLPPTSAKTFTSVLEVLKDEVCYMYKHGHTMLDAHQGSHFHCRAMLLRSTADTRGFPKLDLTTQTPALEDSCSLCPERGFSMPPSGWKGELQLAGMYVCIAWACCSLVLLVCEAQLGPPLARVACAALLGFLCHDGDTRSLLHSCPGA